jgi:hypothetical protein
MSRLDLSGGWTGEYAYPGGIEPTTPFAALIEDRDGVLSGSIVEPNLFGPSGGHLGAVIHGYRQESAVDFVKTYDGASDAAHAVDYVGRLSEDGCTISGVWSVADLDGTFEMSRDATDEEPVAAKAEAEVELDR